MSSLAATDGWHQSASHQTTTTTLSSSLEQPRQFHVSAPPTQQTLVFNSPSSLLNSSGSSSTSTAHVLLENSTLLPPNNITSPASSLFHIVNDDHVLERILTTTPAIPKSNDTQTIPSLLTSLLNTTTPSPSTTNFSSSFSSEAQQIDKSILDLLTENFLSGTNSSSAVESSTDFLSLSDFNPTTHHLFPYNDTANSTEIRLQHVGEEMIVIDRTVENLPLPEMLGLLIVIIAKGAIIVGGAIPYIPQYFEIRHRRNASGFSLYVCLTLFIANILRIEFWMIKKFDIALLIQSIIMILAMILMLEISVRMNRRHIPNTGPRQRTSILKGDFFRTFWQWHDLPSYAITLIVFTLFTGILTGIFNEVPEYVETLGTVALLTEAGLALPQLYKNCTRRSTLGMNAIMVLLWLVGDVGKTIYYFYYKSPTQFFICSFTQITIDILILIQVFVFGRRAAQSRLPTYVPSGLNSKDSI